MSENQQQFMTLTLEEAIKRVPMWAGAANLRKSPLGGGITNQNYRIDVEEESFVLRIPGVNTEMLGINRQVEYTANLAAGELGVAPQVVYFIRPEGYLITRFIHGRPIPPEEMRQSETIRQVTAALRDIHAMPGIPGTFSAFRIVEDYTQIAQRFGVVFPRNFDWLIERMRTAEAALLTDPFTPRPCHNDLLNENFLFDGRIRILDWEYAGMGDPFFDLANFSVNHNFDDEQDRQLLAAYFGAVTPTLWARLKVMRIMSDFREAMWGMVQCGISELDFDFRGYADKHFTRMTHNMQNPLWGEWIATLGSGGWQ